MIYNALSGLLDLVRTFSRGVAPGFIILAFQADPNVYVSSGSQRLGVRRIPMATFRADSEVYVSMDSRCNSSGSRWLLTG
jgi:hypothetical protein